VHKEETARQLVILNFCYFTQRTKWPILQCYYVINVTSLLANKSWRLWKTAWWVTKNINNRRAILIASMTTLTMTQKLIIVEWIDAVSDLVSSSVKSNSFVDDSVMSSEPQQIATEPCG